MIEFRDEFTRIEGQIGNRFAVGRGPQLKINNYLEQLDLTFARGVGMSALGSLC